MTSPRSIRLLLTAIVAAAALARFWGLDFGLPHTEARPDESTLVGVALRIARGDLHPNFFNYPTLFMYVLAALYRAVYAVGLIGGWFESFDHFLRVWTVDSPGPYLLGRTLSAASGTATVAVLYLLGRRLFGRETGIVGAAFLALAFLHVRDSHFGVTDVTMTLMVVCAVFWLVRAFQDGRARDFAIAGLFAGLATSTKYQGVLLVLSMLVVQVLGITQGRLMSGFRPALQRAALFLVPFVLVCVAGTPFALADFGRFWRDVRFEMGHMQRGHGPDLGPGWRYHATVLLPSALGWPLVAAGALGFAASGVWQATEAALVWSFPAFYYAVSGSTHVVFARYMVPLVPFLCLAAALCVRTANEAIFRRLTGRARGVTLLAASALILYPSAARVVAFDRLLARPDNRVVAAEWLRPRLAEGESVYQTGSRYGQLQLGKPRPEWVFDEGRRAFFVDNDLTYTVPDWIVVQRSPIAYYSQVPAGIEEILAACYGLTGTALAATRPGDRVYDQQDAFFLPLDDFSAITRPGPDFHFYRRLGPPLCGRDTTR
jgi:4-amino-4-deoxy-L-arabinose transferase-like glycosyltransferase